LADVRLMVARDRDDVMDSQLADINTLHEALICAGRSPEIPESADAYGWLVGSWELDVLHYWAEDVSARGLKAEVHAAWVLEGLAVQDVWIMPPRPDRACAERNLNMYGTTLRVWDRRIQAWRITWQNPVGGHFEEQVGRRHGNDVVQIGMRPGGTPTRWSFTEITGDSFHWLGESFAPDRKSWILEGEFRAHRIN
jgi:hypothetical protein